MEAVTTLSAPQREAILEFLKMCELSEEAPHKTTLQYVCPFWRLRTKMYPSLIFTSEKLNMAGRLDAYLRATIATDDPKIEYVWRYTPEGSTEDIEVARWLFVRGCLLDERGVENGKLRWSHLRLTSHNPKHVFQDLGQPASCEVKVWRFHSRGYTHREDCAYDVSWKIGDVTVSLSVPIEHVFRGDGIERVDVSAVVTTVPYSPFAMQETRRGNIRYLPRPPWNTIPVLNVDLLLLDVYYYNNDSEQWEFSPAHLDERVASLPEAWQNLLYGIARAHLRTRIELRAEFLEAFVHSYSVRLALMHSLERSEEMLTFSAKDFRHQLCRWYGAEARWREVAKLLSRMQSKGTGELRSAFDPRIYDGFDAFAETPQAVERLAKAEAAFAEFEKKVSELNVNIGKILARQNEAVALRQRIYSERRERAELRAALKRQGMWSR